MSLFGEAQPPAPEPAPAGPPAKPIGDLALTVHEAAFDPAAGAVRVRAEVGVAFTDGTTAEGLQTGLSVNGTRLGTAATDDWGVAQYDLSVPRDSFRPGENRLGARVRGYAKEVSQTVSIARLELPTLEITDASGFWDGQSGTAELRLTAKAAFADGPAAGLKAGLLLNTSAAPDATFDQAGRLALRVALHTKNFCDTENTVTLRVPALGREARGKFHLGRPVPAGGAWSNSLGMKFIAPTSGGLRWSVWLTRVRDYEAFVSATGSTGDDSWGKPPFKQTGDHPVCNVSWQDGQAFCRWLTQRERELGVLAPGLAYRLPTDLEWSAAVGLGREPGNTPAERSGKIPGVYPWGTQWPPPQSAGNLCSRYSGTTPVGEFPANQFGLHDLAGNLWEWCEDGYDGGGGNRVIRGGAWVSDGADDLLSSCRYSLAPDGRYHNVGFRCVLVLGSARKAARTA